MMADRKNRTFTSQEKVALLREHYPEGKPVSAVCEKHEIAPKRTPPSPCSIVRLHSDPQIVRHHDTDAPRGSRLFSSTRRASSSMKKGCVAPSWALYVPSAPESKASPCSCSPASIRTEPSTSSARAIE